ncbi:hypothetical protein CAPTEDRAFT_150651 [Capitella teleta]|uniref:[histone H3]-lysine(4) N-trimethyltransferase n=1 Tax=Capitella teleta TaxID=283909 RepID=R7VDF4_CAPTE|nr:hypothetical protein CAPTEDRAFT_150651 [Capitella teleta]|eukprot:ELU13685.1 hypothetical protein CAPTEDRAFT_150651 [Capitella teleta]
MQVTYEFLFKGIDVEDVDFIKKRYEELLGNDSPQTYWLNDTHWVDHSHTRIPDPVPPKKRKKYSQQDEVMVAHKTGCARTEGYYKISHQEKHGYLKDFRGVNERDARDAALKKKVQISREARSESRRWQNVLQLMGEDIGDLLKFNQLKFRKKNLKFAKSGIHDWGLFALEPIAEGEMVIEYVGAVVRQSTADLREKKYEAMGIGSSYLFRIDHDLIIDATKCGNLARFINHSCNPNCVAKIITVESHKKIVIYSRRDIGVNEEITYDYKFPLEDEKIPCLCGTSACRGTLN